MTKLLLAFLTSSASVVALLVATKLPFFSSHPVNTSSFHKPIATVKSANLSIASPILGLANSHPHILDANLRCNCSFCLKFS